MDTFDPFAYGASYIKLIDCGHSFSVVSTSFRPRRYAAIEPLDDDHYLVCSTGDIRRYSPRAERKGDRLNLVRKSFSRLKALINCNYDTPESVRFVTLTYAANMTDNKAIRNDWTVFRRRMRVLYGDFRYIYVKERQQRGAWHLHVILFFDGVAPYMSNDDVSRCWQRGFVNVRALRGDLNNLGNYLCAYLTDDDATGKKGSRLVNYDSGVRLWCCSRDIRRPVERELSYYDYLRIVDDASVVRLSCRDSVNADVPYTVRHELYLRR